MHLPREEADTLTTVVVVPNDKKLRYLWSDWPEFTSNCVLVVWGHIWFMFLTVTWFGSFFCFLLSSSHMAYSNLLILFTYPCRSSCNLTRLPQLVHFLIFSCAEFITNNHFQTHFSKFNINFEPYFNQLHSFPSFVSFGPGFVKLLSRENCLANQFCSAELCREPVGNNVQRLVVAGTPVFA